MCFLQIIRLIVFIWSGKCNFHANLDTFLKKEFIEIIFDVEAI